MANDYTQNKTPIFSGINDQPQEATDQEGSNASDLIEKINQTLDWLKEDFQSLEGSIDNLNDSLSSLSDTVNDIQLSIDVKVTVNNDSSADGLFVKYIPYYAGFTSDGFLYTRDTDFDNLSSSDTEVIREISIDGSEVDLTSYVEFNGIGIYIFIPYTDDGYGNRRLSFRNETGTDISPQESLEGCKRIRIEGEENEWLNNFSGDDASGNFRVDTAYGSPDPIYALEVMSVNSVSAIFDLTI